jgi:hypothetical protein
MPRTHDLARPSPFEAQLRQNSAARICQYLHTGTPSFPRASATESSRFQMLRGAGWTRWQEARLLPVYYLLTPTVPQLKDVMKRVRKAMDL